MIKEISEYHSKDGTSKAEVVYNVLEGFFSVYFYEGGKLAGFEDYFGKDISYVEDAAENWVLGIKKL